MQASRSLLTVHVPSACWHSCMTLSTVCNRLLVLQYLFEVLKQIPRHYRAVDWISAGPKALTIVYEHAPMHAMEHLPGQVDPGVYLGIRCVWDCGRRETRIRV